ncbi:MAG: hypothetical protein ACTSYI_01115 [Promethearchaeota archaeon]
MSAPSFKLKYLMFNFTDLPLRDFPSIFDRDYQLTVGVDIKTSKIAINGDRFVTISYWDISNKKRYDFIRKTFYKGSFGVLILGTFNNSQLIQSIQKLILEINEKAPGIPYLVYNIDPANNLPNPFSLEELDISFKTIPIFDIQEIEKDITIVTQKYL